MSLHGQNYLVLAERHDLAEYALMEIPEGPRKDSLLPPSLLVLERPGPPATLWRLHCLVLGLPCGGDGPQCAR